MRTAGNLPAVDLSNWLASANLACWIAIYAS